MGAVGQIDPFLGQAEQAAFVAGCRGLVRQFHCLGSVLPIIVRLAHGVSSRTILLPLPDRVTASIVETFPPYSQNLFGVTLSAKLFRVTARTPSRQESDANGHSAVCGLAIALAVELNAYWRCGRIGVVAATTLVALAIAAGRTIEKRTRIDKRARSAG